MEDMGADGKCITFCSAPSLPIRKNLQENMSVTRRGYHRRILTGVTLQHPSRKRNEKVHVSLHTRFALTHDATARTIAEVRPEDLRVPEDRKSKLIWDVQSDFVQRTLAAVQTVAGKLAYCSGLKQGASYVHWGLEKKYGRGNAQSGIREAHRDVLRMWLGLGCQNLEKDFLIHHEVIGLTEAEALQRLTLEQAIVPSNCDGLERDNYLVQALILRELVAAGPRRVA